MKAFFFALIRPKSRKNAVFPAKTYPKWATPSPTAAEKRAPSTMPPRKSLIFKEKNERKRPPKEMYVLYLISKKKKKKEVKKNIKKYFQVIFCGTWDQTRIRCLLLKFGCDGYR
jgi:hypothetical protein